MASPVSDCLYSYGLAGIEGALGMRDLKDFAYLKKVGGFVERLRKENEGKAAFSVSRDQRDGFVQENELDELQSKVTELILKEWGITFK